MTHRERQRGQGLVEFTFIVPVVLLIVASVAELGLAFGNSHTIGYGSREGARVGSALATGRVTDCSGGADPAGVDAALVSAVQRILKSPGSGLNVADVIQIRIFKATSTGTEIANKVNVWNYVGEENGPEVDPGPAIVKLDFGPTSVQWPACQRVNSGSNPDSVGVTVVYRYRFVTPLPSVVNAITGGDFTLPLTETTVMALNPTV